MPTMNAMTIWLNVLLRFVTWLLIPLGKRGTKRPIPEETQTNNAVPTPKEAFARQRQRGPAQSAEPSSVETRSRPKLPSPSEHLHIVPDNGTRHSDASTSSSKRSMQARADEPSHNPVVAAVSHPEPATGLAPASQQSEGSSRCLAALSEMGPLQEDSGPGRQITQHPNERHDSELGATLQDDGAFGGHYSISCPSEQEQADSSQHLGLHLEISRLEISPRKLSWPYLGHILGFILKSLG